MIKSGASNIRKFQFFETIKDTNPNSSEKDNSEKKKFWKTKYKYK